jgi:hypothetical protein
MLVQRGLPQKGVRGIIPRPRIPTDVPVRKGGARRRPGRSQSLHEEIGVEVGHGVVVKVEGGMSPGRILSIFFLVAAFFVWLGFGGSF